MRKTADEKKAILRHVVRNALQGADLIAYLDLVGVKRSTFQSWKQQAGLVKRKYHGPKKSRREAAPQSPPTDETVEWFREDT